MPKEDNVDQMTNDSTPCMLEPALRRVDTVTEAVETILQGIVPQQERETLSSDEVGATAMVPQPSRTWSIKRRPSGRSGETTGTKM